ncbi:NYN domain-containing protein [Nocardia sp. NPDC127606]|uniref:NYN domain-containing protein n=1 Tax=Nocardia sp. NPDC127606 TaxID=3345406 RepID=UPI003644F119
MSDPRHLIVVDAANVIGSRPNGWWKDRPGAARRLLADLANLTTRLPETTEVTVVLEGAATAAADGAEPSAPRMKVVLAERSGDDQIVDVVVETDSHEQITVVTADRELRTRVEAHGAETVGPGWLWNQIEASPASGEDRTESS